ncbi:MAG: bile acid:sodium symporter family protein [Runella slithyformis]|nr:MAG: bile acid:sodium symporter family protein [Runella slithyformis]TAF93805.1 MAG: bile acid:sodium symporter family protein [Runella sp.]TAG15571.1 MAG: bile acid:sodium symporter family protein [Cytophagales bacterium]TAG37137.1 MAG: bile acid:sodium symporter family protein [Cytophagia bacterium]TAF00373.1 MAG: bile acid:sodium symporter family protein [Runella slithyformis]
MKNYLYTLAIIVAATLALFFPAYFTNIGTFQLKTLIVPLLQVIMFGMGTTMSPKDFEAVVKSPKSVVVGLVCQFTVMPLLGFTLATVFGFEPEIAAGVILIGCSPSGLASNVMAYIAKANVALSLTITSLATLMAPILTPLLMKILGGEFIEIEFFKMMVEILKIIILPIGVGLLVNRIFRNQTAFLNKYMPLVSMVGIALIICIITAAGRDSLLKVGGALVLCTLIHNLTGFMLGYWGGRLLKLPEQDCRTVAIEVGLQNGGLASGIALQMGKVATVGLAPALFGPIMNVNGSLLASWWSKKKAD